MNWLQTTSGKIEHGLSIEFHINTLRTLKSVNVIQAMIDNNSGKPISFRPRIGSVWVSYQAGSA